MDNQSQTLSAPRWVQTFFRGVYLTPSTLNHWIHDVVQHRVTSLGGASRDVRLGDHGTLVDHAPLFKRWFTLVRQYVKGLIDRRFESQTKDQFIFLE
jgi:hypothetical protein